MPKDRQNKMENWNSKFFPYKTLVKSAPELRLERRAYDRDLGKNRTYAMLLLVSLNLTRLAAVNRDARIWGKILAERK